MKSTSQARSRLPGEQIFAIMSDIDPVLIAETLPRAWSDPRHAAMRKPKRHPFAWLESGRVAVVLSVVVAAGVLAAIVLAGRLGTERPPAGIAESAESERMVAPAPETGAPTEADTPDLTESGTTAEPLTDSEAITHMITEPPTDEIATEAPTTPETETDFPPDEYEPVLRKVSFEMSELWNQEISSMAELTQAVAELRTLCDTGVVQNPIRLMIAFPADLHSDPEYCEARDALRHRPNNLTSEEIRALQQKLIETSKKYHENIIAANIDSISFIEYTATSHVSMSPYLYLDVDVSNITPDILLRLSEMTNMCGIYICREESPEPETSAPLTETIQTVESLKDYFFSDLNRNGSLSPDPNANGTPTGLLDPDRVPQENRTDLGGFYSIRLTPELTKGIGAYESGLGYLHFRDASIDDPLNNEYLIIYLESDHIDLVLTFKTFFGSTEAFRQAVESGSSFKALLCHDKNVEFPFMGPYVFSTEDHYTHKPLGAPYTEDVWISAGHTNHVERASDETLAPALSFALYSADEECIRRYCDNLKKFHIYLQLRDC